MTTCRNKTLKRYFGKRFIVGYIAKAASGQNETGHFFVKGKTYLYSFKDAIPIASLGYSLNIRMKLVNEKDYRLQ